jgi:hypothetical protein
MTPSPPRARPTEAIETLRKMRELLSVPERWTKASFARDRQGNSLTNAVDPRAVCWCLVGAGKMCGIDPRPGSPAYEMLLRMTPFRQLSWWNDAPERTHAEVLDLLDRAIAQSGGDVSGAD